MREYSQICPPDFLRDLGSVEEHQIHARRDAYSHHEGLL